jgi:acetyl esterase/lipase
MGRTAVIGHSAGGHLALWLGARHRLSRDSVLRGGQSPWLTAVISLAGIADLGDAWNSQLGSGAVDKLMGGGPEQYPERYSEASPVELLPTGLREVLIHGRKDDAVPIVQSEGFVQRARAVGDRATLLPLDGVGHMDLIDPESGAWNVVARSTLEVLGVK